MVKRTSVQQLFEALTGLKRSLHGGADHFLGAANLTRSQVAILFLLLNDEPLSVSEIADQTGVTNGAATQTIEVMVKRDLVERQIDDHDRRVVRVHLTATGHRLAADLKRRRMTEMERLFSSLDDSELDALVQAVTKLEHIIKENQLGHSHR